ncbi:hypothetical protein [Nocardia sp. NPDC057227]|uniref:hypothetical protein n=1 Tax=Nocardia sp. NPDC057227 TaxID=3346056 RepID=UPI003624FB09
MPDRMTPVAPLRGAFVGSGSGAVAAAAHAMGGGVVAPGGPATAALLAACCLVGVLVEAVPQRPGFARLLLVLALGQAAGHWALTHAPQQHHGAHSTSAMLAAHLVAIPLGAVLIGAAERAAHAGIAALARLVPAPNGAPAPIVPGRIRPGHTMFRVPRPGRLASGLGVRGPPCGEGLALFRRSV